MRMILTEDLTDDTCALFVGRAWAEPHIVHGVQNAAMHGFKPIPCIRQSAGHDYTHGIVEIGTAHLSINID